MNDFILKNTIKTIVFFLLKRPARQPKIIDLLVLLGESQLLGSEYKPFAQVPFTLTRPFTPSSGR